MICINEIHYDNTSTDTGEFVEIFIPAGQSYTDLNLVFINGGSNSNPGIVEYETIDLDADSNVTVATDAAGNTYLTIFGTGIQNGSSVFADGLALVNEATETVLEFISYEGTITGAPGSEFGFSTNSNTLYTSTDIIVDQSPAPPIGSSLQKQPDGTWLETTDDTPGTVNLCLLKGTNILTEKGYQKIETLKIGDTVLNYEGEKHKIKWIGIQTFNMNNLPEHFRGTPILFKAGSLGENLPKIDLQISPDHAIFIDDVLINAGCIVNGETIIETKPKESFQYFHIELDSHELIVAEGVATESYLPQNEVRAHFDNADEFKKLYPNGSNLMLRPMNFARIASKFKVPNYIEDKLLKLANIEIA